MLEELAPKVPSWSSSSKTVEPSLAMTAKMVSVPPPLRGGHGGGIDFRIWHRGGK